MQKRNWIALLTALCLIAVTGPLGLAEFEPEPSEEPVLELIEEPVLEASFELGGDAIAFMDNPPVDEGHALNTFQAETDDADPDGEAAPEPHAPGWAEEDGGWVWYTEEGERATGWVKVLGRWYLLDEDGLMLTGWQTQGDVTYYLMDSGAMAAERWLSIDDSWYYFNIAGRMLTGWRFIGGRWYYLEDSGKMATGWVDSGDDRYYMSAGGVMSEGWRWIDGSWYYFRPGSGKMATGWRFIDDHWYFLSPETGEMATGWLEWKDHTYYLMPGSGVMAVGEVWIDGNPYTFAESGALRGFAPFEITFMDIGRNDGILIYCGGEYAFIDSGLYRRGVQAFNYMNSLGIHHLKYYIGSHSHEDHVGGAPYIIAHMQVDEIIGPHDHLYHAISRFCQTGEERAAVSATPFRAMSVGSSFSVGGAVFTCLGPINVRGHSDSEENNNSLILRGVYGDTSFLLTGDATGTELTEVEANNPGCMDADLFKNPHHYARQEYAATLCSPKITLFTTDSGHLPSGHYVEFLNGLGSAVYFTAGSRDGNVKVTSDGTTLRVYTHQ